MAGKNGGARPGAGRPRKAEKYAGPIAAAEQRVVDHLPRIIDKMIYLAMGGFERTEEKYEYEADPTSPLGERREVLVERKVSYAEPDRQACAYLIDRILGKATQALELENGEGGPLKIQVVYADAHGGIAEAAPGPGEDPQGDEAVQRDLLRPEVREDGPGDQ